MQASAAAAPQPPRSVLPGIIGVAAFLAVVAAGLWWSKWSPYGQKLSELFRNPAWTGKVMLDEAGAAGAAPSLGGAWAFARAYFEDIWPGFLAALGIGAAVETLVPRRWLLRTLSQRTHARGSLAGGIASLPSLMCTCCTAPIAVTLRRDGVPTSAALAYWIGNPVLNPAVLAFLALVAPWQWVVTRILVGWLLVFGGTALVARLTDGKQAAPERPVVAEPAIEDVELRGAPYRFAQTFARLFVRLVPIYVVVVLLLGLFRGWIFPLDASAVHWVVPSIFAAAILGAIVVIPTAGEIPIVLGLAAAGVNVGALGALLITLPAISIVSIAMVSRTFSAKVTLAMASTVAASGALAGGLLWLLTG